MRSNTVITRNFHDVLRDDPCAYCGGESHVLDHITSRRRGGSEDDSNLVGACWSCNSGKGGRSLLAYLGARLEPKRATAARSRWAAVGA